MSIDHGKVLALVDRIDDVCTRMTSKDGFLTTESDPRRLLWQIGDELREAAAAIAKLAESIDMVTAEHIGGCPFTGTPNSISSCACAWWLAHDAAQPAEAVAVVEACTEAAIRESTQPSYSDESPRASWRRVVRAVLDTARNANRTDAAQGAVATVCLVGERYAHGHMVSVELQLASEDAPAPKIGDRYYTHPQAAPEQGDGKDCTCQKYEGRDCRRCFNPPYPDGNNPPPLWGTKHWQGSILQMVGEMRNFADVADRCELTEGNAPAVIRLWADRLAAAPSQEQQK